MIYKKNYPELPKDVVNMFDLGFLGVEEDFPQQLSSLPFKKEKDCELSVQAKRVQQESLHKEDSDRIYHLQVEEIQNNGRCI